MIGFKQGVAYSQEARVVQETFELKEISDPVYIPGVLSSMFAPSQCRVDKLERPCLL
jgi:hypothetical protein